jgi:hypothetical protein
MIFPIELIPAAIAFFFTIIVAMIVFGLIILIYKGIVFVCSSCYKIKRKNKFKIKY